MPRMRRLLLGYLTTIVTTVLGLTTAASQAPPAIIVSPHSAIHSVAAAIRLARPGTLVRVEPGVYREPMIIVDKPLEIVGDGWPVLDGEGRHQIMAVSGDDVTVHGLVFRNVGASYVEDRAALKVSRAHGCTISNNRIENGFFGIYLAAVTDCRLTNNVITGAGATDGASGNGIHLWSSSRITIDGNRISGQRDGIYFEFVHDSEIRGNTSERNLRYGLHFMYSDDCRYLDNIFRANGAG